jgi:hypothetical protein
MISWIKKTFPDTYEFIRNFFKALNNKAGGHSLRKWLSIGVFWVLSVICIRYTDVNNAVSMATVLAGLIVSLIVTNTVGNHYDKKLEKLEDIKAPENEQA